MKNILFICCLAAITLSSCEKTPEEKREEILENKLENQVHRIEIEADSLRKEAEQLENQADALDQQAGELKDSLKNI